MGIHFTLEDWDRVSRSWQAWWAHELDRPIVALESCEVPEGTRLPEVHGFASNFGMEMPAAEIVDRFNAHLETRRFYGDAFPKWWVNFGPGIVAGFVGAKVHSVPETVWFEPRDIRPIPEVHPHYDPANPWWTRVTDLTRAAVERWNGLVAVGHTDLGGNLDIVASLRGTEQLLLDLCDAPEEVGRLVRDTTMLWGQYYNELLEIIWGQGRQQGTTPWATIWSPGKCYMLQCDFSYMISPEMFERFVVPDLSACCELLEHGFYHLDGKGQIPHLDLLLDIPRLRGIQWVPGAGMPEPQEWPELLKRIKDAGKLCQLYVSPEGALRIVRDLGGKGFALHVGANMKEAEARDFLNALTREDKDGR